MVMGPWDGHASPGPIHTIELINSMIFINYLQFLYASQLLKNKYDFLVTALCSFVN